MSLNAQKPKKFKNFVVCIVLQCKKELETHWYLAGKHSGKNMQIHRDPSPINCYAILHTLPWNIPFTRTTISWCDFLFIIYNSSGRTSIRTQLIFKQFPRNQIYRDRGRYTRLVLQLLNIELYWRRPIIVRSKFVQPFDASCSTVYTISFFHFYS